MYGFPRFRYLLLTLTSERGSPLRRYRVERLDSGLLVEVQPARWVTEPEFEAVAEGLARWTSRQGFPLGERATRSADCTIRYRLAVSPEEVFARTILDPDSVLRIAQERTPIMEKSVAFLHACRDAPPTSTRDEHRLAAEWHEHVAGVFCHSVEILLIDEIFLREFERILLRRVSDDNTRWNLLKTAYRSPYVEDVVRGLMPSLPDNKEWRRPAPPLVVPVRSYAAQIESDKRIQSALEGIDDAYERSVVRSASLIYTLSEETHYVLGSLMLLGNTIFESVSPEVIREPQLTS